MQQASDRVSVYIDGSNLYHALSQLGRRDLDFGLFAAKLTDKRRLVRTYYYNAPIDQTKEPKRYIEQQRFFQALKTVPYLELRLGRLIYQGWPNVSPHEKGVDIKIATDMLVHGFRGNYNTAILVSGDNDFEDALQGIKDLGLHVEVALFGQRTSQRLREVADEVIFLDATYLADCWRSK